ncbi:MAG: GAP family protein [Solirubrobacterales bacterium]
MGEVFLFAFTAALNPTLLAATTVMLLLPNPKRLLIGYLLGAMLTSITLGLVIAFSLEGSSAVNTAQNTLSPAADFTLGGIALVIAFVLATGRDQRLSERRRRRKAAKEPTGPPRWQRALGRGSARDSFIVGALLTLPGGSYLAGLDRIAAQDLSTPGTVLTVLAFNLIMLILLEVPTLGYLLAPESTPGAVERFKGAISRRGRRAGIWGASIVGTLLIVRAVIELLA